MRELDNEIKYIVNFIDEFIQNNKKNISLIHGIKLNRGKSQSKTVTI